MDLLDELQALSDRFRAEGIAHALCGAVALALHGVPRATQDIDVLVARADLDRARLAARDLGFTLEGLPMRVGPMQIEIVRLTKIAGADSLILDLLAADHALRDVLDDRIEVDWERGTIAAVSREGLVRMKLAAGRPQDLADVARLQEDGDGGS